MVRWEVKQTTPFLRTRVPELELGSFRILKILKFHALQKAYGS